ncbi:uncharacterized protein EI97DRAFT_128073 [Westerdykella ornata]|uniref:Uncharacterized protein n=1 Tax=Westerdykella ornata TaxID=318751 RepID=A0A6A6JCW1_WESOR|nr:uncharacterized protein EI97DRAFT_128073 [Westerdykella ornata]KAF2274401.1 hypothetical protein EI97DRAFT_128073 [Westerdykella ornata]
MWDTRLGSDRYKEQRVTDGLGDSRGTGEDCCEEAGRELGALVGRRACAMRGTEIVDGRHLGREKKGAAHADYAVGESQNNSIMSQTEFALEGAFGVVCRAHTALSSHDPCAEPHFVLCRFRARYTQDGVDLYALTNTTPGMLVHEGRTCMKRQYYQSLYRKAE